MAEAAQAAVAAPARGEERRPALSLAAGALALALSARAWLGPEASPTSFNEPLPEYAGRLSSLVARSSEDLYLRVLPALPGGAQATVGAKGADGGDSSLLGGPEAQGRRGGSDSADADQEGLVQEVAKNEGQIDAQQRVSVKRYKEARKEASSSSASTGSSSDEDTFTLPEQPDEVRARMPPVRPDGPEMRCGEAISTASSLTTRNVEIGVKSEFQGKQGKQYTWKYIVSFRNRGDETVQMLTRHWIFTDDAGSLSDEVKGPGARGVTPVLPPGAEWSYESGTSLQTPFGSMHGSFQFEVLKGDLGPGKRSFSARVARLLLASTSTVGRSSSATSKDVRRKVPCPPDEQHHAGASYVAPQLPLTSVLVTERVILGGRATFVGRSESNFMFSYDIQINNARDDEIEIVAHSWKVVGADGRRSIVAEGPGVGGVHGSKVRRLAAGDAFRVQGNIPSGTSQANAEGRYRVIIRADDGTFREIEASTDFMGLATRSSATHVPNYVAVTNFR